MDIKKINAELSGMLDWTQLIVVDECMGIAPPIVIAITEPEPDGADTCDYHLGTSGIAGVDGLPGDEHAEFCMEPAEVTLWVEGEPHLWPHGHLCVAHLLAELGAGGAYKPVSGQVTVKPKPRTYAGDRCESEQCEAGTYGCSINHGVDKGSCEGY